MEKKFTLLHTLAVSGIFSSVTFWYGYMIGTESSRKQLDPLIQDLRSRIDSSASPPPPPHS